MMLLVILGIGFMWIVQLFFLEQKIIDTTVSGIQNKLQPFD